MFKFVTGMFAGAAITVSMGAGFVNDCSTWKRDAAIYEAIIFTMVSGGDAEKHGNIKANFMNAYNQATNSNVRSYSADLLVELGDDTYVKITANVINTVLKAMQRKTEEAKALPRIEA
tara:strand:- start:509 stop:862 length:354 start_codon:yes stop_codon:yes gene_type:complete